MRKSSKALVALGIGIAVNALVITGIFVVPCTTSTSSAPPKTGTNQPSTSAPAFGSLSDCSQARTAGFLIVGLADTFAAVMVASELAKHSR
jgi:hypothetical protein